MLELDSVTTVYGDVVAVDDISLTVEDGELFCLLGPSGSGKSTALRTVAGFEDPTAGRVVIGNADVTDTQPYDRDCSMVFQDWALFPNKTALENVAFGPKMAGVGADRRHEKAREALELVEIAEYADSLPSQLSGGQKQRVALARSLTVDPDLLLLDEPLSNLDRRLRETMQLELKRIHDRLDMTMLYVTHDQDEAFTLGDRIGVMNRGELVQVGDPAMVYNDPVDRFVESFLGSTNFVDCRVVAADDGPVLDTPMGPRFRAPVDGGDVAPGDEVTVSLRPERFGVERATAATVEDGGVAADTVSVTGTVVETIHRGSDVRVRLSAGDTDLFVEESVGAGLSVDPGDTLSIRWDPAAAVYFDAAGERIR